MHAHQCKRKKKKRVNASKTNTQENRHAYIHTYTDNDDYISCWAGWRLPALVWETYCLHVQKAAILHNSTRYIVVFIGRSHTRNAYEHIRSHTGSLIRYVCLSICVWMFAIRSAYSVAKTKQQQCPVCKFACMYSRCSKNTRSISSSITHTMAKWASFSFHAQESIVLEFFLIHTHWYLVY